MREAGPMRRLGPDLKPARAVIIGKASGDMDQFEALAAKLEPALAKVLMDAFLAQQSALDIDLIIAALEAGNVGAVLELLNLPASLAAFDAVPTALQQVTNTAGIAAAALILPRVGGVTFQFNTLNPRLITWLQTYSLGLIRQINENTRDAVRQALVSGMNAGKGPKGVAVQVKQSVGLTAKQAKAVANYRAQLETFHERRGATAWGLGNKPNKVNGTQVSILDADGANTDGIQVRRLRDFRFDGQLKQALKTGKPLKPEQIDKMVAAYQRKYVALRARTIARTEAIRATNMGIQDAWQQALDKGVVPEALVRKRWIVARDERLCEVCGPIPGMNPKKGVPHAASFQTPEGPVTLPPMHPNCRCVVSYRQYEPSQLQGDA